MTRNSRSNTYGAKELVSAILINIHHIRVKKNISQSDVAKVLGISQNAYSKLERGHTRLQMETIFLISKALNVPLMELIDNTIPESFKKG